MKILLLCFTWLLASMSYAQTSVTPGELINTKWISPVSDSCVTSLCFNSESTVVVKECEDDWSWEIGYTLADGLIKVNIYDSLGNIMILQLHDGVLRQTSHMESRFAKNYSKTQTDGCE